MTGPSPARRVLQLTGPSSGGIRRHVAVLAKILAERGMEVDVASPRGVMDGLDTGAARRHVVEVPDGLSPAGVVAAVRALRTLRRERGGWDVVHAHGLKAGWVALLARPGAPVVLTVHNVVLDEVAGRQAAMQRRLERLVVRWSRKVVAVSPEIVEHFAGVGPPDHVRFVIPASPAPVPRRDRAEVRRGLGVTDEQVLVVVAARLHPQKDLPLFVDAWRTVVAAHPTARAVIVGEGPARDEVEAAVARAGVDASLTLAGASPHAVDEIAAADLVVLSSRWEGAPLVVAEAMQLGRPLVSTRVGVVPEMAGDGAIIVDVGDRDALASAIERFVASPELRAAAGEISRERGTVIYGAAPLVDRIERVYGEVVER